MQGTRAGSGPSELRDDSSYRDPLARGAHDVLRARCVRASRQCVRPTGYGCQRRVRRATYFILTVAPLVAYCTDSTRMHPTGKLSKVSCVLTMYHPNTKSFILAASRSNHAFQPDSKGVKPTHVMPHATLLASLSGCLRRGTGCDALHRVQRCRRGRRHLVGEFQQ